MGAACTLAAGFLCGPAAADQSDTFNVVAGGTITHDANVLRVPTAAASDVIKVVYAGVRIDKTYGQQQFLLDFTQTQSRFAHFHERDSDTLDYKGVWRWSVTPWITGHADVEQIQLLIAPSDFGGSSAQGNLRTTDLRNVGLDWWATSGWHLLLGANQVEQKSEAEVQQTADFRSHGGQIGARYEARSGSSIAVIGHVGRGDFIDQEINPATFTDNGYRDKELELKLTWILSGRSTLTGRLARVERRYNHFSERNYYGPAGSLAYSLTQSGRLRLDFAFKRDLATSQDQLSSYRVNDSISFTPRLEISRKATVRLILDRSTSNFLGPVVVPTGPLRYDVVRNATLSADWEVSRVATVSAKLQAQRRSSNNPQFPFSTTVASVSCKLTF